MFFAFAILTMFVGLTTQYTWKTTWNRVSKHYVTRAGNNNFHSKSPTANGLITCLLAFTLTVHAKSTGVHTLQHNVSPLYILYYAYISHSLLAITVLALVRVSHSNITVIHFAFSMEEHKVNEAQSLCLSRPLVAPQYSIVATSV